MPKLLPFLTLSILCVASTGTALAERKAPEKAAPAETDRKAWPHYLVNIYGVTDANFPELKKALLDSGNIAEVTKAEPNKYRITAKDPSKPVFHKSLKDAAAKVKGITLTGMQGFDDGEAKPGKTADKDRKAWPQYEVGITGVTKKNWPDLKKAVLVLDNVEDFAMTEPDKFRITAKDPKKPIWYGKVKEAVGQIEGLKLSGMKGVEKE